MATGLSGAEPNIFCYSVGDDNSGSISTLGRNTQGVRLMRVSEGSKVVCVARAEADEEEIVDEMDGEATEATDAIEDNDEI